MRSAKGTQHMGHNNGRDDFSDSDETPAEGMPLEHPSNRELLTFLANDVMLLKEHTRTIQTVYEAIRSLAFPAGPKLTGQLLTSYEKYETDMTANVDTLRAIAAKG